MPSPLTKRLKEARLESGFSQKKLGINAGVDEFVASAKFNQYETGKHTPDYSMVQQIASVLKIPTPYFYTEDNTLAALIKLYGGLSLKKRRELLDYAKKLEE